MKRNFGTILLDLEGAEIVENGQKIAFSHIARNSLMATFKDEENLSGEDKLKRYELAMKIKPGIVEVTTEEVALLKQLIGKLYNVLIVGQLYTFLEKD